MGFTEEIAIHPEQAELKRADFLWRISSARIEQASAFSLFPNHDRVLLITEGGGVRLTHEFDGVEDSTELPLFFPYEFPGDVPSRCELLAGAVRDFSVFFRKGEVEAIVDVVDVARGDGVPWIPAGTWNFAFAAADAFAAESDFLHGRVEVPAGGCLRVDLAESLSEEQTIQLRGSGKLVVVSLHA